MNSESSAEFLGSFCVYAICLGPFVLIIVGLFTRWHKKRTLEKKYGKEIATRLLKKEVWQGMTNEMLLDSRGKPKSIDQTVMKTRTREIWKYNRMGKGQYATRITLEDDTVVGWDTKNK